MYVMLKMDWSKMVHASGRPLSLNWLLFGGAWEQNMPQVLQLLVLYQRVANVCTALLSVQSDDWLWLVCLSDFV